MNRASFPDSLSILTISMNCSIIRLRHAFTSPSILDFIVLDRVVFVKRGEGGFC